MNIALIGPRGSGKSKISRRLSKLTGMPIVSTDAVVIYESGGTPIPDIIKKHNGNWDYFRNLELNILQKLVNAHNIILDCGGGIIFSVDEKNNEFYNEEKAELLRSISVVILLLRSNEYLLKKIKNDSSRPPLNEITTYEEILHRRMPYYKETAHHVLTIDDLTPNEAANKIVDMLLKKETFHH